MNTLEQTLTERKNICNGMAGTIAGRLIDVRKQGIKESLDGFQNIPHRLEDVATVRGIQFINDSKATNLNALWYALESMRSPVIWLAGGQDPGNDYSIVAPLVKEKVKAMICLGVDNANVVRFFRDITQPIFETREMHVAVNIAYELGDPGDVVLLSPACASFDLYDNYADRGSQFKKAIYEL